MFKASVSSDSQSAFSDVDMFILNHRPPSCQGANPEHMNPPDEYYAYCHWHSPFGCLLYIKYAIKTVFDCICAAPGCKIKHIIMG